MLLNTSSFTQTVDKSLRLLSGKNKNGDTSISVVSNTENRKENKKQYRNTIRFFSTKFFDFPPDPYSYP